MSAKQISVITPCCGESIELLIRALESLKNQTLGFDNIEWIVVAHNTKEDYYDKLIKTFKTYKNIYLYKFNDDKNMASTPRNYGLKHIKKEFVTFLDADDYFTKDFLQTALNYAKDDIDAVFSRELQVKKDNSTPYNLYEEDKDNVRYYNNLECKNELVNSSELSLHGMVYRSSVIKENNINFDLIPIAEDIMFNLHYLKHVNKLCFLPNLRGYIWCLRDDSVMHDLSNKSPEMVIDAGLGIINIFKYAEDNKFGEDDILFGLILCQSVFMICCTKLTLRERKLLKNEYAPYILKFHNVVPSERFSKDVVKMGLKLPNIVYNKPYLMKFFSAILNLFHIDISKKIKSAV